jgi:hypothetical protein
MVCGGFNFALMLALAVDRMFLNFWLRCPLTVALDFGRCFLTSWLVSPGQVVMNPLPIAFVHADVVGLKQHWWRYCTRLALVVVSYTLLARGCACWLFCTYLAVSVLCVIDTWAVLGAARLMIHSPVLACRWPWMVACDGCLIVTWLLRLIFNVVLRWLHKMVRQGLVGSIDVENHPDGYHAGGAC